MEDLSAYPEVRNSVLNYGLPDLTGQSLVGMEPARLERIVREAIIRFEPRINSRTLKVTVSVDSNQANRNAMRFDIEGDLWAQPTRWRSSQTELDLESGNVNVTERYPEGPT
jgi:type VI secretion system protein ImpF